MYGYVGNQGLDRSLSQNDSKRYFRISCELLELYLMVAGENERPFRFGKYPNAYMIVDYWELIQFMHPVYAAWAKKTEYRECDLYPG